VRSGQRSTSNGASREIAGTMNMARYAPSYFEVQRADGPGGSADLTLIGSLDIAAVDSFAELLQGFRDQRGSVRLDLSQLRFMDAPGCGRYCRRLGCAP
jgi:hypothetical protein